MRRLADSFIALLPVITLLVACTVVSQTQISALTSTPFNFSPSPTSQVVPSFTDSPIPTVEDSHSSQTHVPVTPTPTNLLWIAPYLPETLQRALQNSIKPGSSLHFATSRDAADIYMGVSSQIVLARWIYAIVTPFPSLVDSISIEEILAAWNGDPSPLFSQKPLILDENTLAIFSQLWGDPQPDAVTVLPQSKLLDFAWENQPAWALIPFEEVEPRWKVIDVDGISPVQKDFDSGTYPLTVPFGLTGNLESPADGEIDTWNVPTSNRSADKLTTLILTGVTALVRGTALTMERNGITYPALDVGEILRDSDLTHISNEIPFTPDCPFPELYPSSLVFCSAPEYIGLLEEIGTDIVELSGDHFGDYGPDAMLYTLQMYDQHGWQVYGGGKNAYSAREPVLIDHNGNRIALLGCNIGCEIKTEISCKALAGDNRPGAAACDFDWIDSKIKQLREQDYSVVFTFQHKEYFTYAPQPDLIRDFGRVAESGAVIVSGSQAHQPHGMAFQDGAFIHYGLGNLFFDQYNYCADNACNYAFIDRHIFYDGRYISTELIPIRFVDMARPRLMTEDERIDFLKIIFQASGW